MGWDGRPVGAGEGEGEERENDGWWVGTWRYLLDSSSALLTMVLTSSPVKILA